MYGNTSQVSGACSQLSASSLFCIIFGFYSFSLLMLATPDSSCRLCQLSFCPVVFPFVHARNSAWMDLSHNLPGGLINSPFASIPLALSILIYGPIWTITAFEDLCFQADDTFVFIDLPLGFFVLFCFVFCLLTACHLQPNERFRAQSYRCAFASLPSVFLSEIPRQGFILLAIAFLLFLKFNEF